MRDGTCPNGVAHDWGSWHAVAMLDLDALVPPGELPPERPITLAKHICARCRGQEMLSVQGAHLKFIYVGVH
jgi:hypothetical protein